MLLPSLPILSYPTRPSLTRNGLSTSRFLGAFGVDEDRGRLLFPRIHLEQTKGGVAWKRSTVASVPLHRDLHDEVRETAAMLIRAARAIYPAGQKHETYYSLAATRNDWCIQSFTWIRKTQFADLALENRQRKVIEVAMHLNECGDYLQIAVGGNSKSSKFRLNYHFSERDRVDEVSYKFTFFDYGLISLRQCFDLSTEAPLHEVGFEIARQIYSQSAETCPQNLEIYRFDGDSENFRISSSRNRHFFISGKTGIELCVQLHSPNPSGGLAYPLPPELKKKLWDSASSFL